MTYRNLGKFSINSDFIKDHPEELAKVFAIMKCVPVRAEMIFHKNEIEYFAIAENFPEIKKGEIIPEYLIKITQSEAGDVESVEIQSLINNKKWILTPDGCTRVHSV